MVEARLPDGLTGLRVVGVTRGAGKIRPTVYFNNGGHFTQSHKRESNIGFHASRGPHLFFGNVSTHNLSKLRSEARAAHPNSERARFIHILASLKKAYVRDPSRAAQVLAPPVNQNPEGLQLLEIWEGAYHPSRSALVSVSIVEANALVAEIRGRSTAKLGPHPTTGEYYFAEAVGENA